MDNSNPQNTQGEEIEPHSSKPHNTIEHLVQLRDDFREKMQLAGIDPDTLQGLTTKRGITVSELMAGLKSEPFANGIASHVEGEMVGKFLEPLHKQVEAQRLALFESNFIGIQAQLAEIVGGLDRTVQIASKFYSVALKDIVPTTAKVGIDLPSLSNAAYGPSVKRLGQTIGQIDALDRPWRETNPQLRYGLSEAVDKFLGPVKEHLDARQKAFASAIDIRPAVHERFGAMAASAIQDAMHGFNRTVDGSFVGFGAEDLMRQKSMGIQVPNDAQKLAEAVEAYTRPVQIGAELNSAALRSLGSTMTKVGTDIAALNYTAIGTPYKEIVEAMASRVLRNASIDVGAWGISIGKAQPTTPVILKGLAADVMDEVTACIDLWHRRPQFVAQLRLCYFDAEARGQDRIEICADDELIAFVLIENGDGHLHGVGEWWMLGDSPRFLNSLAAWLENKLGIKSALIRDNSIPNTAPALKTTQTQEVAQEPGALVPSSSKKPRRRGPTPTSEEKIEAHIKGWIEVMESVKQRDYCKQRGIGVSTLRLWMRQRNY